MPKSVTTAVDLITSTRRRYSVSGLLVSVEFCLRSVGLSVRPLATTVNFGKTADWIEMPFAVVGRVRQRNDAGPDGVHMGKGCFFS